MGHHPAVQVTQNLFPGRPRTSVHSKGSECVPTAKNLSLFSERRNYGFRESSFIDWKSGEPHVDGFMLKDY